MPGSRGKRQGKQVGLDDLTWMLRERISLEPSALVACTSLSTEARGVHHLALHLVIRQA